MTTPPVITLPDLEAYEQEAAIVAVDSFAAFYRWAWDIVEPGTHLDWGWHLDALCEHAEAVTRGDIRRLVVEMPPGHLKSMTFAVMWPAWMWARDPSWRLLCSTHSHGLSKRDSLRRRTIVSDHDFRRHFGSGWAIAESVGHGEAKGWQLSDDQSEKTYFTNTRGGHMVALSVKSSVTGHRGNAIVTDDLIDVRKAYSDAENALAVDHVLKVLPSRVNDPRDYRWVHVQQRTRPDDPAGALRDMGFDTLSLPLEYDPRRSAVSVIGWEDPRETPGELLDAVRMPASEVARQRQSLGERDFEAQFNQSARPAEGGIIKSAWVKDRYRVLPATVEQQGEWLISVDPKGGSKAKGSAYAVIQVWVRFKAAFYLVDQRRGRWSVVETMAALEDMIALYPRASRRLVEAKADGTTIVEMLGARFPGIIAVKVGSNDGDKITRLAAVSPLFEAGNVHLPETLPSDAPDNSSSLIAYELTSVQHGQPAKFMDQVDAATQALNHWREEAWAGNSTGWAGASAGGRASASHTSRARGSF